MSLLAVTAIFCLVAALFLSEARLISLGIMDASLQSDHALTAATAKLEVLAGRFLFGIIAAALLLIVVFWVPITTNSRVVAFNQKDLRFPGTYEKAITVFADVSLYALGFAFILALLYLAFANDIFSFETLIWINREDGVLEYLSALFLLVAALLSFLTARRLSGHWRVRAFHFFLTLLFVAMCGEEISWGQRIFNLETADWLKQVNAQEEINLHNSFGYVFDHLFIALFFAWGCLVPILFQVFKTVRQIIRYVGLPVPSWGLAFMMLLITLLQEQIVLAVLEPVGALRLPEMRELLSTGAFVFLMMQSFRHMPDKH